MAGIKAKLDQYNEEFSGALREVVKKYKTRPLNEDTLKDLFEETNAMFEEFPDYQPAVKLGILERDIKAALFDLIMESAENGDLELCPTNTTTRSA